MSHEVLHIHIFTDNYALQIGAEWIQSIHVTRAWAVRPVFFQIHSMITCKINMRHRILWFHFRQHLFQSFSDLNKGQLIFWRNQLPWNLPSNWSAFPFQALSWCLYVKNQCWIINRNLGVLFPILTSHCWEFLRASFPLPAPFPNFEFSQVQLQQRLDLDWWRPEIPAICWSFCAKETSDIFALLQGHCPSPFGGAFSLFSSLSNNFLLWWHD